jgi:diguanylate cyclase (GGDEF)-like protein
MVRTIKGLLLSAALIFSLGIFALFYVSASIIYERSVREDAFKDADMLAHLTFNTMFQLMSTGWNRKQLDGFMQAVTSATAGSATQVTVYRGEPVIKLFGAIAQKTPDVAVSQALATGKQVDISEGSSVRIVFPLLAEPKCQRCHVNVKAGEVMGAIDVEQDVGGATAIAKERLAYTLLPIIPVSVLAAFLMVGFINRRLKGSIEKLSEAVGAVNRVADLKHLATHTTDLGFAEFNRIAHEVQNLTERLRNVAVDKDMLEFEIKLLEKFIITSEVVRDWREYVNRMLIDINQVMEAYALFSIFKVDDEVFDLEVFWHRSPSHPVRDRFEAAIRKALTANPYFSDSYAVHIVHNVADHSLRLDDISEDNLQLQTKSLLVAAPKIGGIVGIGVQSSDLEDHTRLLVIESILSTLLNVVGSVKAIHKYTKELEYYATRDPLTNLFNQRVFWELLDSEVARSVRHGHTFALLVIDSDNFKSVNDSYGHSFGDNFLQEVTTAIKGALRSDDLMSRYGGDEFTVILPETDIQETRVVARRILDAVDKLAPLAPDGSPVRSSVSIGMAVYPEHAMLSKDLFLFADNMMYRAKAEGKNRLAIPTQDDVVEIFRSIGEKSMLILNAIESKRAEPFFQPIINVGSGKIEAVEVLSRLRMDDGSVLTGDEFVAIAEKMGVMHKLDYVLMEKALDKISDAGFSGLVFLNMSPRALVLHDFIPEVRRIVAKYKFDPTRIVFEITERETIKNMALLEKFINNLKFEGFKLAIDDFGSGFSSFHYVKRFPIDFLKIEGEFVLNMVKNEKDRALVKSIVALAKELRIRTVAEYVENAEVQQAVAEIGIDLAQGFHIGRPHPKVLPAPVAAPDQAIS